MNDCYKNSFITSNSLTTQTGSSWERGCDEDIPIEYKQAQLKYTNINRLVIQEQEEMQRHDCRGERISAWASYSEKMSTQNEREMDKKKKKRCGWV